MASFPLEVGPEKTVQAGIEEWDVCIVLLSDLAAEWPKTVSLSQPGPETQNSDGDLLTWTEDYTWFVKIM